MSCALISLPLYLTAIACSLTFLSLEADTLKKMNYKRGIRKGLETNWFKAADAKYEREIEQKIGIPEKITVQEQLDHYR